MKLTKWTIYCAETVLGQLGPKADPENLDLTFDLHQGKFLTVQAGIAEPLPRLFRMTFDLATDLEKENVLEIKMISKNGGTVRWNQRKLDPGDTKKTRIVLREHDFALAWGDPKWSVYDLAAVEFAISRREGGVGHLHITDLAFQEGELLSDAELKAFFQKAPNEYFHYLVSSGLGKIGVFPRYVAEEQNYWTLAAPGVLLSADGAFDMDGFSLEPFIIAVNGTVMSWKDFDIKHALLSDCRPIVMWRNAADPEISLSVTCDILRGNLFLKYDLNGPDGTKLLLAVRPFMVPPPWQGGGGYKEIKRIGLDDTDVLINDTHLLNALPSMLFGAKKTPASECEFLFSGKSTLVEVSLPQPIADVPEVRGVPDVPAFATMPAEVKTFVKMAATHTIMNRDGVAIQPGPRMYARSWIRDAVGMCEMLLRLGYNKEVADFIKWYAAFQLPSGAIPAIVDSRGVSPLVEHDSHGQFLHLLELYHEYTGDEELIRSLWGQVLRVIDFIDSAREKTGERFVGLMPASISHEGYMDCPMHSYWDDFWTLRGLKDCAKMATWCEDGKHSERMASLSDTFTKDLTTSVRKTMAHFGISYIPGCAEKGDNDPVATSIIGCLSLCDLFTTEELEHTFLPFMDHAHGTQYRLPYEFRVATALAKMGKREQAEDLFQFLFTLRRPSEWHVFAEVIRSDPSWPGYIGDMPHGWGASDCVIAAFALYEGSAVKTK